MKLYTKAEILEVIREFLNKKSVQKREGVLEILGPTGSGKTGFSLDVAEMFAPAEILCVDSRQVYRDMDISSAKIDITQMRGIPHWGLDLVSPEQDFSVYDFQKYAFEALDDILARGHLPVLCGGTMLWLDSVSENYIFDEDAQVKSSQKGTPRYDVLKIGIHWDREILYKRINERAKKQFENGLVEETKNILKKYKITRSALTSFGYKEIKQYLDGEISLDEALATNQKRNRNYAKRQLTWWRGREDVLWVDGKTLSETLKS
ncbi:tRNA (adenosine(37)-N6)-dimethylallyltransferase MiaA [Candidatus Gracilibacteria bacterium]|nr:tRNA (adenosine(37)-N6)-dimethylallyltransferase MiaA [Candidatus Gracilibacteria bacterium]